MTTLYFKLDNGIVEVHLRATEAVNAWKGTVLAPGGVARILSADSNYFWQTPPQAFGDTIIFAGGATAPITEDAVLFRFSLRGSGEVSFASDTSVFAADGAGTALPLTTARSTVGSTTTAGLWEDVTPPQPFRLELYGQKGLFDGRPALIFSAEDEGSGIARYEAREHTRNGVGSWHLAESPYQVERDVRGIEIKAVDNFGNERVESVRIGAPFVWTGYILLCMLAVAMVAWSIMNIRRLWRR